MATSGDFQNITDAIDDAMRQTFFQECRTIMSRLDDYITALQHFDFEKARSVAKSRSKTLRSQSSRRRQFWVILEQPLYTLAYCEQRYPGLFS
jgi:hypothetical protein